ncbi:hypothetical protein [Pseudoxanthomonas kaohsiungensis]|uniref:Uncharacterized protein n=1 Tax=Pseudoxanthomonas kaohsiungensis TaxID=283923 RepID=A0ABW3LYA7_9GAMM|nr:hypothetical protein [Pseudoxanthomonas kaohsiungensis]
MNDFAPLLSRDHPSSPLQADLPGIPRGSTLNEILAGYGLTPTESPGGLRRYRHELTCGALRAVADVWVTADGAVEAFRIWSLRPRAPRPAVESNAT